ncbi:BCCT family transporter [Salinisphaera sp. Q1T1-3]|uniref:BCCT family transporter n=1 Tax=Salinisphaera sp. Q1T1-3 TaxID=2321229 RepID=UPI001314E79D|nr:BCCT family transporter [Salinisphaera sp. Q1T1-3]
MSTPISGDTPHIARHGPLRLAGRVFYPVVVLILALVVATIAAPETMSHAFSVTLDAIVHYLGWYYVLACAGFIGFCFWVGLSRFGSLRIGPDDARPDFSRLSWYTMLFSAGIGIGVIFYGTAEPVAHYHNAPREFASNTVEAARYAVHLTWMEWGMTPFAIYIVVGLALGFATHRRGRPLTIRWGLEPLLGRRVEGWLGDLIDIVAIIGTVFGLATSLGLGVMQINSGLDKLGLIESSLDWRVTFIALISLGAGISVLSGLDRGIKWLSNVNIALACVLLFWVLSFGPTVFLLKSVTASIGYYFNHILQSTFETDFAQRSDQWQSYWTVFFWAWWIAWGPFVGTFLARISRGRTVREFALGVLLIPTAGICLWFGVMGWAALHREMFGPGGLGDVPGKQVIFDYLAGLPLSFYSSLLAIALIVTFFVTSADSGAFVLAVLSTGGLTRPPAPTRALWVLLQGLVSIALALAGGLSALQAASLAGGLPFSIVMIALCVAVVKSMQRDLAASAPPPSR